MQHECKRTVVIDVADASSGVRRTFLRATLGPIVGKTPTDAPIVSFPDALGIATLDDFQEGTPIVFSRVEVPNGAVYRWYTAASFENERLINSLYTRNSGPSGEPLSEADFDRYSFNVDAASDDEVFVDEDVVNIDFSHLFLDCLGDLAHDNGVDVSIVVSGGNYITLHFLSDPLVRMWTLYSVMQPGSTVPSTEYNDRMQASLLLLEHPRILRSVAQSGSLALNGRVKVVIPMIIDCIKDAADPRNDKLFQVGTEKVAAHVVVPFNGASECTLRLLHVHSPGYPELPYVQIDSDAESLETFTSYEDIAAMHMRRTDASLGLLIEDESGSMLQFENTLSMHRYLDSCSEYGSVFLASQLHGPGIVLYSI